MPRGSVRIKWVGHSGGGDQQRTWNKVGAHSSNKQRVGAVRQVLVLVLARPKRSCLVTIPRKASGTWREGERGTRPKQVVGGGMIDQKNNGPAKQPKTLDKFFDVEEVGV